MASLLPIVIPVVGEIINNLIKEGREYRIDPALLAKLDEMNQLNADMNRQIDAIKQEQIKQIELAQGYKLDAEKKAELLANMSDPEQFAKAKEANFKKLLENLKKYPIEATMPDLFKELVNHGFVGITSCGKSSCLNTLAQQNVAATGIDETTTEIRPVWRLGNHQFWDFPGFNDSVDYYDIKFMAFVKSFNMMCLLYDNDIKVCMNAMKLLQALGVKYVLVRTKCDHAENASKTNLLQVFQQLQKIKEKEKIVLTANGINPIPKIYQISCKNARISMKILDDDPQETCGGLYDWAEFTRDLLNCT